jgi:signal transduction histidine kinase
MKKKHSLVKNAHFWTILVIVFILVYLYYFWPWSISQIDKSILRGISWFWFSNLYRIGLWEYGHQFFGIFFLIPNIYCCVYLLRNWKGVFYLVFYSIIGILPILLGFLIGFGYEAQLTYLLLIPVIFTIIFSREAEKRRKERYYLLREQADRQSYLSNVLVSQELERKRIAQELHDDTMQTLIAIAGYAEAIQSPEYSISEKQVRGDLIRRAALQSVENLRRLTLNLTPLLLSELGLLSALSWLINNMNLEKEINYKLVVEGEERKFQPQVELSLFRIVQEALNNVKKHSKARDCAVEINFRDEYLEVIISDNGKGFSLDAQSEKPVTHGKMGIIGMKERVEALKGEISIDSKPDRGTIISIQIKYQTLQ